MEYLKITCHKLSTKVKSQVFDILKSIVHKIKKQAIKNDVLPHIFVLRRSSVLSYGNAGHIDIVRINRGILRK